MIALGRTTRFYDSATGTGAALKYQLTTIMSSGHIQRRYGDFRSSAAIHDQDPNNPNNILLAYNRQSVPATWDSGSTWNREHVWPQSRQPGSANNSSNDGDDFISLDLTVLDHANASFSGSGDENDLALDLGTYGRAQEPGKQVLNI